MKELIINLQGKLDSILGNAFREKTDSLLAREPHKILLDASALKDWDDVGLTLLKNSSFVNTNSIFAVSGLGERLLQDWNRLGVAEKIPYFKTREEAKLYLIGGQTGVQSQNQTESTTACPVCLQILRIHGQGNYRCPACSHTFYLTADYRTASYEKLF